MEVKKQVQFCFAQLQIKSTLVDDRFIRQINPSKEQRKLTQSRFNNFLLTESAVITGKYQTEVLTVRIDPIGRGPYIKDWGLIFSCNAQFASDRG